MTNSTANGKKNDQLIKTKILEDKHSRLILTRFFVGMNICRHKKVTVMRRGQNGGSQDLFCMVARNISFPYHLCVKSLIEVE